MVVPEPEKVSRQMSRRRVQSRIASATSATGLTVGCDLSSSIRPATEKPRCRADDHPDDEHPAAEEELEPRDMEQEQHRAEDGDDLSSVPARLRMNNFELGRHGRSRSNVWNYRGVNTFGAGPGITSDCHARRAC